MTMKFCIAVAIVYSIVEICEAVQCISNIGGVKVNITCERCCFASGGLGCCESNNNNNDNDNNVTTTMVTKTMKSSTNEMFSLNVLIVISMPLVTFLFS